MAATVWRAAAWRNGLTAAPATAGRLVGHPDRPALATVQVAGVPASMPQPLDGTHTVMFTDAIVCKLAFAAKRR